MRKLNFFDATDTSLLLASHQKTTPVARMTGLLVRFDGRVQSQVPRRERAAAAERSAAGEPCNRVSKLLSPLVSRLWFAQAATRDGRSGRVCTRSTESGVGGRVGGWFEKMRGRFATSVPVGLAAQA